MSAQDNIKPLVDGLLQNPLKFKPASKLIALKSVSSELLKNPAFVIISNSSAADAATTTTTVKKSDESRGEKERLQAGSSSREEQGKKVLVPKSMAEAIALYSHSATATKVGVQQSVTGGGVELSSKVGDDAVEETVTAEYTEGESTTSRGIPLITGKTAKDNTDSVSHIISKESVTHEGGVFDNRDDIGEEIDEEGQILKLGNDNDDGVKDSAGSSSRAEEEKKMESSPLNHTGYEHDEDIEEQDKEEEQDDDDDDDDDYNPQGQDGATESEGSSKEDLESSLSDISNSEKLGLQQERSEYEKVKREILQLKEKSHLNHLQNNNNKMSNESGEGEEEEDDDNDDDELKHKKPLIKRMVPSPPSSTQDLDKFYKFNEEITDEGTYLPSRILKSWGPDLGVLKPKGLLNHGVTCYMNAAVQAMLHIPALQHYLFDILAGKYKKTISPESVSMVLAETSSRMWLPNEKLKKKKITYINPKKLIGRLDDINCMMSEWQQEDSHEYFMSLMSRLQEDSVPKGHKLTESIVYDIFGGMLKQYVTCKSCGEISKTEQPFYDLSLHLKAKKIAAISSGNSREKTGNDSNSDPKRTSNAKEISPSKTQQKGGSTDVIRCFSIEKSINDFFNPELIKIDNEQKGYVCERCHKTTNAVKRNTILRAPETLLVHLKKFRFNGTSSSKMKQAVSFPIYLDLTEYCDDEKTKDKRRNLPVKYQLISVVVHEGISLSSGHYIAHCKQPDGTWATYDDEYINRISEADVLRESNAYYLVYTRLTPKEIKLRGSLSRNKNIGLPPGSSIGGKDGNSNNNNNSSNNKKSSPSSRSPSHGKGRRNKRRKLNK